MPEVPRALQVALVVVSVLMFVGSIVAIPWVIRRLPAEHFVRPPRERALGTKILRNVAGVVVIGLGVAMLVLPGQGIIAILCGLSIMDLKVKRKVIRRMLCQPRIERAVQHIRAKAGKPPLVIPRRRRRGRRRHAPQDAVA